MTFLQSPIYCCMLGAIAVRLLKIVESSKLPTHQKLNYKSFELYSSTIASIVIAVIVGYIYFDDVHSYNRIVYFHTGASSPMLVSTISRSLPTVIDNETKRIRA
ncbi:hypothetical protein CLV42_103205 [Chitinophaga ginsengisoli]|uniref:Uncharacterized protein n=1 Tax=Chitinophaga ginsengisoli TaxID=363837 RepID=A0A2P8GGX6_9BACT|nr:hypothetical protein CLV42_103205 [Chitinophaga ginsengisoli]